MSRLPRWRFLAAQRSGRVTRALMYAGLGVLVVVLAITTSLWHEQVVAAARFLLFNLAALGLMFDSTVLAAILIVVAIFIYATPLPRSHSYLVTSPSRIPRVAVYTDVGVYVDAENQPTNALVEQFVAYVHAYTRRRRADLVLFSDANNAASGNVYQKLVSGGFRPVDVPHVFRDKHAPQGSLRKRTPDGRASDPDLDDQPAGVAGNPGAARKKSSENAVDLEMSLYAYQQAMLAPHPIEVVIVSGDQDYIPLIRRLWAEGHTVTIWAREIAPRVQRLAAQLGERVTATPFSMLFAQPAGGGARSTRGSNAKGKKGKKGKDTRQWQAPAVAPALVPAEPVAEQPSSPPEVTNAVSTPLPAAESMQEIARRRMAKLFSRSLQVLASTTKKFGNDEHARQALGPRLGAALKATVEPLGFSGSGWVLHWLMLLRALGVFKQETATSMPERGQATPQQGADLLLRFLLRMADTARQGTLNAGHDTITLIELRDALIQATATNPDMAELTQLVETPPTAWPNVLQNLTTLATALGILDFDMD